MTLKHIVIVLSCGLIAATPLPLPKALQADLIVVHKSARTLDLFRAGKLAQRYTRIQFGDDPQGHKSQQGDEKTPEGRYIINGRNSGSRYHLSLRISYPNAKDKAQAIARGVDPGGDIMIHGQRNWVPMRIPGDWTNGCIALSNAEIEAIWSAVPNGTPILIKP